MSDVVHMILAAGALVSCGAVLALAGVVIAGSMIAARGDDE